MKKKPRFRFLATSFLLLCFPIIGFAVSGPILVCDTPVYPFGQVDASAVITNVFIIRNAGDTTGVLGRPRSTCGCTTVRLNKTMIGPGETASLTVVFTAAGRSGQQKRTIYLPLDDQNTPPLILSMEGFVTNPAVK